jgi:hypothetical protein
MDEFVNERQSRTAVLLQLLAPESKLQNTTGNEKYGHIVFSNFGW